MNDVEIMKEYLLLKFRESDWHGVMDAAADLRDIMSKQEGIDEQREKTKYDGPGRSPVKDEGVAGLSKELGRYDCPPRMVAGGRIKADFGGEQRPKTIETPWGVGIKGFATGSITTTSTTEDILHAIRKDLYSLQQQINEYQSV